jgi:hypothetical protein
MMKHIIKSVALLLISAQAFAGPPQWTWEAGKQTNNGAITIKSMNGGTTYSGTQNPTGAVAKTNQNAVTQPPTVVIQATSGGQVFNYKDDCFIFDLVGHAGTWFIGAGKIDTVGPKFTGIMGWIGSGPGYYYGGGQVFSALTGAGFAGNSSYGSGNPVWCGVDASCAWNYAERYASGGNINVVGASVLPILTYQKCYP